MHRNYLKSVLLVLASSLSLCALAHTSTDAGVQHTASFVDGLLHPLSGADHLAAMLCVGLWSALTARRTWQAPLGFAAMLLVGVCMGLAGMQVPAVEPAIATSLLVLGLLVAKRASLPASAALALVSAFAIFHGLAHGFEMAGTDAAWTAVGGLLLTTLGLHIAGLALGTVLKNRSLWWPRLTGAAVTLLGTVLLVRMI